MTHPKAAVRGKAVGIDLELMILRGHGHPACPQIEHRVVPAVMTESQARRARTGRLSDELMPKANAKHREAPDQLASHRNGRLQLRRVTRSVRQHDGIRLTPEDGLDIAVVRKHLDLHSARAQ